MERRGLPRKPPEAHKMRAGECDEVLAPHRRLPQRSERRAEPVLPRRGVAVDEPVPDERGEDVVRGALVETQKAGEIREARVSVAVAEGEEQPGGPIDRRDRRGAVSGPYSPRHDEFSLENLVLYTEQ